jgi:hypothetical protein
VPAETPTLTSAVPNWSSGDLIPLGAAKGLRAGQAALTLGWAPKQKFIGARHKDRAPGRAIQLFGQGLVVVTRSGLPGELFGKISVTVHEVDLSAVAMTGTPGVSM